jgi:hypothetical protein
MKTDLPEPDPEDNEENLGVAHCREGPDDVLESVDRLLTEHGLEVVTFDTQSDTFVFAIRKREA